MRVVLVGAGYEVECHCDGRTALACLRERPADLLLLDLRMPMMDGWEFRVAQRPDSAIADIPVVVMTGDTSAKAAAIHADGSLVKPFGTEDLALLEGSSRTAAEPRQATSAGAHQDRSRELNRGHGLCGLRARVTPPPTLPTSPA